MSRSSGRPPRGATARARRRHPAGERSETAAPIPRQHEPHQPVAQAADAVEEDHVGPERPAGARSARPAGAHGAARPAAWAWARALRISGCSSRKALRLSGLISTT